MSFFDNNYNSFTFGHNTSTGSGFNEFLNWYNGGQNTSFDSSGYFTEGTGAYDALFTGNDFDNFNIGFDDLNEVYNFLDKDLYQDGFTTEDLDYLDSIGADSTNFATEAFGVDGYNAIITNGSINGTDYYNPDKIISDTFDFYSPERIAKNTALESVDALMDAGLSYNDAIKEVKDFTESNFSMGEARDFLYEKHGITILEDFAVNATKEDVMEAASYHEFLERIGVDEDLIDAGFQDTEFGQQLNQQMSDFYRYESDLMNPIQRKRLIDSGEKSLAVVDARLAEHNAQIRKTNRESYRNQQRRFRGFMTEEDYQSWKNQSDYDLELTEINARLALEDYILSDEYGNEFHDAEGNARQELIDDYTAGRYYDREVSQADVDKASAPERIDLTLGLDSGEELTNSGKLLAIGLDLIGLGGSSKLYLTQAALNWTINRLEGVYNKLAGSNIDLPNFNAHEMLATLVNKKFVNKDGESILKGVADATSYLFPLYDPSLTLSLGALGDDLGKFTPTGESLGSNFMDVMLEGGALDKVQEASEEGKYENIDLGERKGGIQGFLSDVKTYVQGLAVGTQKIFQPTIAQFAIDNALFGGLPVSNAINGLAANFAPKTAEDWVRWANAKGLDPNKIEESDISYWRSALDEWMNEPKSNGITTWNEMVENLESEGLVSNYFDTLNTFVANKVGKEIDQLQPVDLVTVLTEEVGDQMSLDQAFSRTDNRTRGTIDIGNGFFFGTQMRDELLKEYPDITEEQYGSNYDYLLSEGTTGTSLGEEYQEVSTTTDAAFYDYETTSEGYYVIDDFVVQGYAYEMGQDSAGNSIVIDPLTDLAYEFNPERVYSNNTYAFPTIKSEHIVNTNLKLGENEIKQLMQSGRMSIPEVYKYARENPLAFLGLQDIEQFNQRVAQRVGDGTIFTTADGELIRPNTQAGGPTLDITTLKGEYFYNDPTNYVNQILKDDFEPFAKQKYGITNSDIGQFSSENRDLVQSNLRPEVKEFINTDAFLPWNFVNGVNPYKDGMMSSLNPFDEFLLNSGRTDEQGNVTTFGQQTYDDRLTDDTPTYRKLDYEFISDADAGFEVQTYGGGLVRDPETGIVEGFNPEKVTSDGQYLFPTLSNDYILRGKIMNPYANQGAGGHRDFQGATIDYALSFQEVDRLKSIGALPQDYNADWYFTERPLKYSGEFRADSIYYNPQYTNSPGSSYLYEQTGRDEYTAYQGLYKTDYGTSEAFQDIFDDYTNPYPDYVPFVSNYDEETQSYVALPDFNVNSYSTVNELILGYNERVNLINNSSMSFAQREYEKDNLFKNYTYRKNYFDIVKTSTDADAVREELDELKESGRTEDQDEINRLEGILAEVQAFELPDFSVEAFREQGQSYLDDYITEINQAKEDGFINLFNAELLLSDVTELLGVEQTRATLSGDLATSETTRTTLAASLKAAETKRDEFKEALDIKTREYDQAVIARNDFKTERDTALGRIKELDAEILGLEDSQFVQLDDFVVTAFENETDLRDGFNDFETYLNEQSISSEQKTLELDRAIALRDLKLAELTEPYTLPDLEVTADMSKEEFNAYLDTYESIMSNNVEEEYKNNVQTLLAEYRSTVNAQYDAASVQAGLLTTANREKLAAVTLAETRKTKIGELDEQIGGLKGELSGALSKQYIEITDFDPAGANIKDDIALFNAFTEFKNSINSNENLSAAQKERELNIAQATYDYYSEIIEAPFVLDDYVVTGTLNEEDALAYHTDFLNNLEDLIGTEDGISQDQFDNFSTLLGGMKDAHISNLTYKSESISNAGTISELRTTIRGKDDEIGRLEQGLYVEVDSFNITSGTLEGATAEFNAFVSNLDSLGLTDAQKALETSFAQNSLDLFNELNDIYVLPDFAVTATDETTLNTYLDNYLGFVDQALADGDLTSDQALSVRNIIESVRTNGVASFAAEAESAGRLEQIGTLKGEKSTLEGELSIARGETLASKGLQYTDFNSFDPSDITASLEGDPQKELQDRYNAFVTTVNESSLSDGQKQSEIAFADKIFNLYNQDLEIPAYELPDFSVISEGDLTGLNNLENQSIFELDNYLENNYITQEQYDENLTAIQNAADSRKSEIVPIYELPEFAVTALNVDGTYEDLEAEYVAIMEDLQFNYLDEGYINVNEYNNLKTQIDTLYSQQRADITPVYELPDFSVYTTLEEGGTFDELNAEYDSAKQSLFNNAQLGYMTSQEYIDQLQQLEISYNDTRTRIAPAYELPDFTVYGTLEEGSDFTEIDAAYESEKQALLDYANSGFITTSEYYNYLTELDNSYTQRREGIMPAYTLPDFEVTGSMTDIDELYESSLGRIESFVDQGYFPAGFDVLDLRNQLTSSRDAARLRLQNIYTLPDFEVTDTEGVFTQDDIQDLFDEYDEGLQTDVMGGLLDFSDYTGALDLAKGIFDTEYAKRKPLQPIGTGLVEVDDDFYNANPPFEGPGDTSIGTGSPGLIGGIDIGATIGENYMAKLDPAYQLAEILLGEAGARDLFPTGKSRGIADDEFMSVVNAFQKRSTEDSFEIQEGLAGRTQALADEQKRLQRQSDINLLGEFGEPYKQALEELYPEGATALQNQADIARRRTEEASGGLTPDQRNRAEQNAYLFGAERGREYDPITLMTQLGEEEQIRQQRDTLASSMNTQTLNMERGFYGDLPGILGTDSPFIQGVGQVETPFNIAGLMDLGTTDYANQQRLQEAQSAVQRLQNDYNTALAMNEPSRAKSLLVQLGEANNVVSSLSSVIQNTSQAFGTVKNIFSSMFGNNYAADQQSFNDYYSSTGKGTQKVDNILSQFGL